MSESIFRISLRGMLLCTWGAAMGVASFFLPGGYLVYLPLLVIGVLTNWMLQLVRKIRSHSEPLSIVQRISFWVCLISLVASMTGFVPLFDIALGRMSRAKNVADKKLLISKIEPESFREAVLRFKQTQVFADPSDSIGFLEADRRLPPELLDLDPLRVSVNRFYVFVLLHNRDNQCFGLKVFDDEIQYHRGDEKLGYGVWYWELPSQDDIVVKVR